MPRPCPLEYPLGIAASCNCASREIHVPLQAYLGAMLIQISVLISAYQLPSTRVQPLVGRPASIGGRAMPLRMHQAEAPLRRALHTIVHTCPRACAASRERMVRRLAVPRPRPLPRTTTGSPTPPSTTHGAPPLCLSPPEPAGDTQFPTRSMPAGRYAVAFSEQLGVDDVFSTRLWGEPVVLYRDARKEVRHKK